MEFSVQPFVGFQCIEFLMVDKFRMLIVIISLVVGVMTLLCRHNEFRLVSSRSKVGGEIRILLTLMCSVFMFVAGNWMWFYI